MATRPTFNKTDIASLNPVTAGNALTAELATQAFPESQQKRQFYTLFTLAKAATAGAAGAELFIDGVQNFRFRIAERSTTIIKATVAYNSNVAANNTGFDVVVAVQNIAGVLTILGTPLVTKYPAASTAAVNIGIDAANQALTFTAVGVAGDTNGRWVMDITSVSEVTDIG